MKNIIFIITVFFALILCSVTVSATSITLTSAVEDNKIVTVSGIVSDPVADQCLVVTGCPVLSTDWSNNYDYNIYFNNIAAPLDEDGRFILTLDLSNVYLNDDYVYVIRIGGSNINSPAVIGLERDQSTDRVVVLGDVNLDGYITADDAALTMQYVLYGVSYITDEQIAAMRVTGSDIVTADNAAYIMNKVLDSSFVFPAEE